MDRREFLSRATLGLGAGSLLVAGCRSQQVGQVLTPEEGDLVGNTNAGAATFNPLIDEAVAKLLTRHQQGFQTVSFRPGPMTICFVGVENRSAEELGDFRDQIYQQIDAKIEQSNLYRPVNARFVDAALKETRMRPEELFLPQNMQMFCHAMGRQGQMIDALLFATLTSGTTRTDGAYQRDYLLTLEMVSVHTGDYDKEMATVRKGYEKTKAPGLTRKGWFSWW